MQSHVKLIKLVTGEELLAQVIELESSVEMVNALAVVMQPGPTDSKTGKTQMAFAFVPWGTMVDGEISIKMDKIIYIANPEEQVLNHYNNMFGLIQTPPKGLVIAR